MTTVAVLALLGVAIVAAREDGVTDAAAWDLPAMEGGGRVALADFSGTPTVVNFFASWCTACDDELPGFAAVSDALRGQVDFVGVASLETGDPLFMPTRHGITWWPLARDINGGNGSGLHEALGGGNSMPLTAFYDGEGTLVDVHRGVLIEAQLRERVAQLFGVTEDSA